METYKKDIWRKDNIKLEFEQLNKQETSQIINVLEKKYKVDNLYNEHFFSIMEKFLTISLFVWSQNNYATIQVYRDKEFPSGYHPRLYINDTLKLRIPANSYDTLHIKPGNATVRVSKKVVFELELKPGHNYYFKVNTGSSIAFIPKKSIIEVTEEFARREILNKNYKNKGIKDGLYFD